MKLIHNHPKSAVNSLNPPKWKERERLTRKHDPKKYFWPVFSAQSQTLQDRSLVYRNVCIA